MKLLNNPKIYKIRYGLVCSFTIFVCLFWDQLLKIITDGFNISVIPNFLNFQSTHNTGAAYGIFSGQTLALIIVSSLMLVLIFLYNFFKKKKTIFYSISLGLICGGAIGNLIDRIFLGYVRDFVKFSFFSFNCNIADICLTVGVVLFAIYLIFLDDTFKSNKPKKIKKDNINADVEYSVENKQSMVKEKDE